MSWLRERWYGLLLVAYPPSYRQQRGAEIQATLADASQAETGPRLLALRQAASLVASGLRTRARLAAGGSAGRLWRSGLQLGVLLLLLSQVSADLGSQWAEALWGRSQHLLAPPDPVALLPFLAAVSLLRGRVRHALVLSTLTATVWLSPFGSGLGVVGPGPGLSAAGWPGATLYLLPVLLLGLLAWRQPSAPPRSWLWLLVPILAAVDAAATGYTVNAAGGMVTWLVVRVVLVGALVVVPLDPRPAIAATILLVPELAASLGVLGTPQPIVGFLVSGGLTLVLGAAGIWGTRRLART